MNIFSGKYKYKYKIKNLESLFNKINNMNYIFIQLILIQVKITFSIEHL